MEEIHMSPTSTPPVLEADGEDPCMIDVTDAATDGVTVLICLCGLVGNGAMIWFLGYRSRRNPITVYILNFAIADFAFLLFVITSSFLYMIENVSCSTVGFLKHVRWLFLLSMFSCYIDFYLLAAISIERCMSILHPSSSRRRPQWLTAVVCVLLWVICIVFMAVVTFLCLVHEHEQCETAFITTFALNSLLFVPPIFISNVIRWIKVPCGSQRHQPRMFHFFFTDLYFLLFAIPFRIFIFLQEFIHLFMSYKVAFLLAGTNSSISPFIYYLVGSCQRPSSFMSLQVAFRRVFGEPEDNSAHSNQIPMGMLDPACQSISNTQINQSQDSG